MKKKILFLISTLTGGGAEKVLCNLTLALNDKADIDILINAESPEDYEHAGRVMTLGLPFSKKLSVFDQINIFLRRIKLLRQLKKSGGYDECISFMNSSNFANIVSGRRHCRVIVSERVMLSKCTTKNYVRYVHPLVKLLYPHADKVVAVSEQTQDDLIKNFGIKSELLCTINNGLDLKAINERMGETPEIAFEDGCFYFVSMGRFTAQKRHWHLVRAFARLAKDRQELRLIILGTGPMLDKVRTLAGELGVKDKVIFALFCKNPYAILSRSQVFVTASGYEGFANMLLEAMACHLPVISSDFKSSAREILAPDTPYELSQTDEIEHAKYGVLLPVCSGEFYEAGAPLDKNEELLCHAMREMYEDKGLREHYSRQSDERAPDFDMEKIADKWLSL